MRRFRGSVLLLIMAMLVPILKAHAGADVLVPSDTNENSNTAPDLGLTPGDSAPGDSTSGTAAQPLPSVPSQAATQYLGAAAQGSAPVSGYSQPAMPSLPSLTPEQMDVARARVAAMRAQLQSISPEQMDAMKARAIAMQAQMQANMPDQAQIAQLQARMAIPTTVVQSPDMADVLKNQESLPDSVDVSLASGKLNPFQAQLVTNQLGISNPASACHVSVSGYVQATKDSKASISVFDLGMKNHGTAKFDGKIDKVTAVVRALCNVQSLPANRGFVLKVGDKYSASLGLATCSAPASGAPHKILVTIPENGAVQCQVS